MFSPQKHALGQDGLRTEIRLHLWPARKRIFHIFCLQHPFLLSIFFSIFRLAESLKQLPKELKPMYVPGDYLGPRKGYEYHFCEQFFLLERVKTRNFNENRV